jgi:hypothetical protein
MAPNRQKVDESDTPKPPAHAGVSVAPLMRPYSNPAVQEQMARLHQLLCPDASTSE